MNPVLFISIFSLLTIFYFILGLTASKKVKTVGDYFVAGRSLGFMPVTMTLVATQIGSGMLLGTAQQAYEVGLYGLMYTVGMSIGFLILGCGLAGKLQSFKVMTTAELFKTKYNSIFLKRFAAFLAAITMCGLLIGQIIGSKAIITGLGIGNEWIFLSFWLLVIAYTMIGGLHAVVLTDMYQVCYILIVFGAIFLYSLFFDPTQVFSSEAIGSFSQGDLSSSTLMAIVLMPALFSLFEQDLAQRFFASRTKKIAMVSALCASGIMIAFSLVPIYFGMYAKLNNLVVPTGGSPLIPTISALTNEFIVVLAVCGLIAAITSTADSLLNAVTSNIVIGFGIAETASTKKRLLISQIVTLATGAAALIASYWVTQDIIGVMISSYELSVSCLLVPLLFAYFGKNLKKSSAFLSVFFGLAGFILFRIWPIPMKEIAALGLSLTGYLIGKRF